MINDYVLATEDPALDLPLKNYRLITDYQDVAEVAATIARYPRFGFDLETDSLDFKRGSVHGVALATEDHEWYVTLGAEQAIYPLLADLVRDREVVGHNLSFDFHFAWRHDIRPRTFFDTMIARYLANENSELGLKVLAPQVLHIGDGSPLPDFGDLLREGKRLTGKAKLEQVNINDIPLEKLAAYAARDARLTLDLRDPLAADLHQEGMTDIFWNTEMPFVNVLVDMEGAGFFIDRDMIATLEAEFIEARETARLRWLEITQGVSISSTQQIAAYLFQTRGFEPTLLTPAGKPAVNVMALNRLKAEDTSGAIEALLTYRKHEKLIGTYVINLRERMYGDRIYTNFNRTGTETGRLSSSGNMNFQNIPNHGELGKKIRYLFAESPGYTFLSSDYSQLELRILAHYTKDPTMMGVFASGGDPHQMTVDMLGKLGFVLERVHAKRVNFGYAYSMGPRGLCDTLEKDTGIRPKESDAKLWLRGFAQAYPVMEDWKRRVIRYAHELGYVKTIGGRKRRLPELNSRNESERAGAERSAVNAIIQGSAADITQYAMLQIYPLLQQFDARILAQVHDEINFRVPEDCVEAFSPLVQQAMEGATEHFGLRTALVAKPSAAKTWAEAH